MSPWSALGISVIVTLVVLAAISIAIHLLLARAYQLGPTAVVAGLDFSYLGFAVFWAILLLGTFPDGATVLSTTLIGAGGLWGVSRRSRRANTRLMPRASASER